MIYKDIWIFIAYEREGVPMFSKLFSDFDEMKIFSGKHSAKHKSPTYSSSYLKLTDKSFLKEALEIGNTRVSEINN